MKLGPDVYSLDRWDSGTWKCGFAVNKQDEQDEFRGDQASLTEDDTKSNKQRKIQTNVGKTETVEHVVRWQNLTHPTGTENP